jgi:spectinomycin phosphotransferase
LLEKPNISDSLIIDRVQDSYALHVNELTFLPLGADQGTAVYRVVGDNGKAYFLKVRKGFEEITVTVPLFLQSQGVQEIISPIETSSKQGWADFGEYKLILYPFVEGQNGFEMELSDDHRRSLGASLKKIHAVQLPPELQQLIPQETFSPTWRESMKSFLKQVDEITYSEPTAQKLAQFIKSRQREIHRLLERADALASRVYPASEFVLCHTDIHGGNILLCNIGQLPDVTEKLYAVDWDNPLLAPKERDLMFIGGGIDEIWKTKDSEAVFYEGYGKTEINMAALAYYRYERVIEDLAVICEQLLLTDEGGADRERSFGWFTSNFEPGQTIEIADKTYDLLSESGP